MEWRPEPSLAFLPTDCYRILPEALCRWRYRYDREDLHRARKHLIFIYPPKVFQIIKKNAPVLGIDRCLIAGDPCWEPGRDQLGWENRFRPTKEIFRTPVARVHYRVEMDRMEGGPSGGMLHPEEGWEDRWDYFGLFYADEEAAVPSPPEPEEEPSLSWLYDDEEEVGFPLHPEKYVFAPWLSPYLCREVKRQKLLLCYRPAELFQIQKVKKKLKIIFYPSQRFIRRHGVDYPPPPPEKPAWKPEGEFKMQPNLRDEIWERIRKAIKRQEEDAYSLQNKREE